MGSRRVLIVEDNSDSRTLLTDILSTLDCTVLAARDGAQGLAIAASEKPDLILMDLSLPQMDGWTATSHIKADERLRHIPIIALTAHAMVGDREKALAAGCDDYISKPIDLRELQQKLAKYLGQP
ncbi:MAG: response regulator [Anaerolineae bacterium]|nr:response regulator [Anaerolineae bacterium]